MPDFLDIDGRAVHVAYRPGQGRPVVFANSLGTDLRIWDGVVAGLPARTPVLRMDKRGHGLSEGTADTIEAFAGDVAAMMDRLGISGAIVCGVSVGGLIAQGLALARPDVVAALLLSTTGLRIGSPQSWQDRMDAVRAGGLDALADRMTERWFSAAFRGAQPTVVAGYRTMLARQSPEGYLAACCALRDADFTDSAAGIEQPALCLAGETDIATPPETLRALAGALPRGRYLELAGVGHLPCIEAPDAVSAALTELGAGA